LKRPILSVVLLIAGGAAVMSPLAAAGATTRAEYIAQADPICAHELAGAKRTLGGVNGDLVKGRFKQAGVKFTRANNVFKKGVDSVAALAPPSADASLITQWVQMLRAQIPLAARAARVLKQDASPQKIRRAIGQLFKLSDRTQALVKDYGFNDCAFM
jgi:hypothetical protein